MRLASFDHLAVTVPTGAVHVLSCRDGFRRHAQCLVEVFPAKVWVTIFPSFTTKVSVPSS
jgi:hypothetical protein